MTTPTPLPLDAAALAARLLEVERENVANRDAAMELAAEGNDLRARVAELEAELAEARSGALAQRAVVVCNDLARIDKERMEWQSHAKALRDVVAASEAEWRRLAGPLSAWSRGDRRRDAARDIADDHARVLAQTPAASLAAHDAEVLERAAGVCDVWAGKCADIQRDAEERWDDVREAEANAMGATAEELAAAIRALAAQAQEVKP